MAGVNKRPMRSGTDWSRYTPFSYAGYAILSTADVLETVLSINGQGYLSNVIFSANITTGADAKMKITIDGTVVFFALSYNESQPSCIVQEDAMDGAQIRSMTGLDNFSVKEYPFVDDTTSNAGCVMGGEIFFNTSLLIELLEVGTTSAGGVGIRYNGGYIA